MSAEKPSRHLSPITALAHKISGKPVKLQESSSLVPEKHLSHVQPAPSTSQTASERQNIQPEEAERNLEEDVTCPVNVRKTQRALKAADHILPPVSSPFSGSSSVGRPQSLTSSSQLASSSTASLHGL
ncbi:hypothetical protein AMECASPLE_017458 [Ameca splendens]|uniref:Uncharacterized protein n=1 Tax=Ameca splendens TaxID=208324 RepID=A0ABV0YPE2_9TELE